jgi:hypothetical protein
LLKIERTVFFHVIDLFKAAQNAKSTFPSYFEQDFCIVKTGHKPPLECPLAAGKIGKMGQN